MVIPLVFVVVAPGSPEPLGVFNTPHNALGFLRDNPECAGATVLEYRLETPATVRAPVRWRYVDGELVGPAGEHPTDMFGHLQVEAPDGELHYVVAVRLLDGWRLHVEFDDGTAGTVDMGELLESGDARAFTALRDHARFAEVCVEHGAVTWPGGLDLAPEPMYDGIKAKGVWAAPPFEAR